VDSDIHLRFTWEEIYHAPNTNKAERAHDVIAKTSSKALRFCSFFLLAFICALASVSSAQAKAVYGLVVGVDDYVGTKQDLKGAVNDANDIAQALRRIGASRVIALTDGKATKKAIQSGWFSLIGQAQKGDTIIFSYAGHGSQEPEPAGRKGEADGKNENFLLAGFTPKGPGRAQRIVDDEIFQWLKAADDKGVQVIFVADSCHSGSMNRQAKAPGLRYRKADFGKIEFDQDLLANFPPPAIAKMNETSLKNVTFIAATQEDKLTPEVEIDGRPRGALSWAFARALEGAADQNKDGELTQVELVRYLVPAVHQQVEAQQTPEVRPLRPRSQALVTLDSKVKIAARAPASKIKLAMLEAEGSDLSAVAGLDFVRLVSDPKQAELIWNTKTGEVQHKIGGKIATRVTPRIIKSLVAKWALMKILRQSAMAAPIDFALPGGNHRYAPGTKVTLQMKGAKLPHLTLFNLAPNGRVEFFIPTRADEQNKDWRGQLYKEQFTVKNPPYGAEHVVALFTKDVQVGLHSVLKQMKTEDQTVKLPALIAEFLKGVDYQLGIAGIYTGKGG